MSHPRSLALALLLSLPAGAPAAEAHIAADERVTSPARAVELAAVAREEADFTEVELDRWRLLQRVSTVEAALGAPFVKQTDARRHQMAFRFADDAYLVAETGLKQPGIVTALQLSGRTDKALRFLGLRLGDHKDEVIAALGTPTSIVPLIDSDGPRRDPSGNVIALPAVVRYDYDGRNYSVELDQDNRLYSIRLTASDGVFDIDNDAHDPWPALRAALLSGDFAQLEPHLRPDVELFTADAVLAIERPYRDFVQAPDTVFVHAFFAEHGSVAAQLRVAEPASHIRIFDKQPPGRVYRFPQGQILEEIVLMPYDGRYRIFEVRFRAPPAKAGDGDGASGSP